MLVRQSILLATGRETRKPHDGQWTQSLDRFILDTCTGSAHSRSRRSCRHCWRFSHLHVARKPFHQQPSTQILNVAPNVVPPLPAPRVRNLWLRSPMKTEWPWARHGFSCKSSRKNTCPRRPFPYHCAAALISPGAANSPTCLLDPTNCAWRKSDITR